ncbi:MAG: hypothetical protein CM1200mP41_30240 [Gammaproteobacteria bacterium]|nr:MAG: hypothetical protein CM1200mP41_30240 [Gammaproteobacteria bacterium]
MYAGSGLRGYGNLLILKHDHEFLSAYAHNRRLLVKENDTIAAGVAIAEMGRKHAGRRDCISKFEKMESQLIL